MPRFLVAGLGEMPVGAVVCGSPSSWNRFLMTLLGRETIGQASFWSRCTIRYAQNGSRHPRKTSINSAHHHCCVLFLPVRRVSRAGR